MNAKSAIVFTIFLFSIINCLIAQKTENITAPELSDLLEIPDDEYIYVAREGRPTSPPYRFSSNNFSIVQVNVDENGNNIMGDAANEPSIAIDPTNPNRMVIGWRQFDTIESNFRQAGFAYSNDAGTSWTFPGVIEPGVFRSDPVLDFDVDGNFYYNSLTTVGNDFICNVYKSTGDGTWDAGTYAFGGDKQWMVIDRTDGIGQGNIYAFWAAVFSVCPPGSFTRSLDGGDSYEDCEFIPQPIRRGILSVGPDGELYACGHVGPNFYVTKSLDAQDADADMTWETPVLVNLDGELERAAGPNPSGMLGQVNIATDHSDGPTRGNVYLLCSVKRFSNSDVLDVMFARSTDGGLTWSDPIKINDDTNPAAWQWFGTLSVAPNGRVDVAWVDTRENPSTFNSALYFSYSEDGGETWSANEKLSDSFDPFLGFPQQQKIGDYYEMISDNEGAHLTWSATFNGEQDIFYSYIPIETVSTTDINFKGNLSQNTPNPFSGETMIEYSISEAALVQLEVFDLLGQKVGTLVNERQTQGAYNVTWAPLENQTSGLYFYQLSLNGVLTDRKKMILIK